MNYDIPKLCCSFLFIIASQSFFKNNTKNPRDVSKNMPCCHFLLIVIVIAIMLIYKEFFKNAKMRRMLSELALGKVIR